MNWQNVIDQIEPIQGGAMTALLSERDREKAAHLYNKSLQQIHQGSDDIAQISLRRLIADYPEFGQASLLAGLLLARDGHWDSAVEYFSQAAERGHLPADLQDTAEAGLDESNRMKADSTETADRHDGQSRTANSALNANTLLQKSRPQGKVRLASEREVQKVLQEGDLSDQTTFVQERREPMEIMRTALPVVLIVLVAGLIIFAAVRLLPSLFNGSDQQSENRLDWLISRLETMSAEDAKIGQLLNDYQVAFPQESIPAESSETTVPIQTTPADTTAAPTTTPAPTSTPAPTPSPTPDPAVISLSAAADLLQTAQDSTGDLAAEADALLEARALLVDLPDDVTLSSSGLTAAQLRQEVDSALASIADDAADLFRQEARPLFDQGRYEESLYFYLKAFELEPDNYGGGVAYYCGRNYQELGLFEEARPYYDYVIETFPGRDIAIYAANRLRQMGY